MAESVTPRVGLTKYSSDLDEWDLEDFNRDADAVEATLLLGKAGLASARPAASAATARMIYHATDTDALSYCDGATWRAFYEEAADVLAFHFTVSGSGVCLRRAGNIGFINMSAVLTGVRAAGQTVATIPAGFRPTYECAMTTYNGLTFHPLNIKTDGTIVLPAGVPDYPITTQLNGSASYPIA